MTYGPLLLAFALGCGGKPAPAPVEPAATAPLELTFQTFAQADSGQRPVAMGSTLKTGDRIALSVSVTSPAYIYVLQFFPDGKAGILFPGPGEERAMSGTQRIPGTGWFELDEVVGTENVYVIASKEPLAQADAAVKRTVDEVRTTGLTPVMAGMSATVTAGSGSAAPKANGTEGAAVARTNAPGEPVMASRGLTRVEADNSIRATADERGVAVFRFSFSHVAR